MRRVKSPVWFQRWNRVDIVRPLHQPPSTSLHQPPSTSLPPPPSTSLPPPTLLHQFRLAPSVITSHNGPAFISFLQPPSRSISFRLVPPTFNSFHQPPLSTPSINLRYHFHFPTPSTNLHYHSFNLQLLYHHQTPSRSTSFHHAPPAVNTVRPINLHLAPPTCITVIFAPAPSASIQTKHVILLHHNSHKANVQPLLLLLLLFKNS
ncbi:hypothetical protein Pmani_032649 [Petrolisthes manimaculis]|uniref:Uncharacterized protein n=1 Tax=Petrolisthes manimaculis TaxID=1843537 RepID=A0AAE1NT78_9EUCA|nr:hypothetical protein Pmani_032649 [Petrolisthes manimaculis]